MNKIKKLLSTILAMTMIFTGMVGCNVGNSSTGSENSSDSSEFVDSVSIVLKNTVTHLDKYDKIQIEAITGNVTDVVTWTSSNPSVATVNNGLVYAVSAGIVTITASVGGVKASCEITVTDSYSTPTLDISNEYIGLGKGDDYTVSIATLWKGSPIQEDIEYTWTLCEGSNEIVEVKPNSNGSEVTFTGINYGTVSYYVSTTVYGVPLVELVEINVCNADIIFEAEGLEYAAGAYKAILSARHSARL